MPRFGPRPLVVGGLTLAGTGLVLLGHVPVGATYAAYISPGLVLIGFGAGFSFSPSPQRSPRSKKPSPGSPPDYFPAPRKWALSGWPSSSRWLLRGAAACSASARPR